MSAASAAAGEMEREPRPADQAEWDKAATVFARETLAHIRSAAEKWVGTISALLGLFGTIFVFAGPETLAEIEGIETRIAVFGALALALLLAATAIFVGALAAQGIPREWDNWNGSTYRAYVAKNSRAAAARLAISRWLGVSAAFVLVAASLVATFLSLPSTPSTGIQAVVVTSTGDVRCGLLVTSNSDEVQVGGVTLTDVTQVAVVDDCGRVRDDHAAGS